MSDRWSSSLQYRRPARMMTRAAGPRAAIGAAVLCILFCGLATLSIASDAPANKADGAKPKNAQARTVFKAADIKAADDLARKISSPGSPAYAAAFRTALDLSLQPPGKSPNPTVLASLELNKFDYDTRFDSEISRLVQSTKSNRIQPFIYHGDFVQDGKLPAVVAVETQGSGPCTGTVIAPSAVLTAAHCACPQSSARSVYVTNSIWAQNGKRIEVAFPYVPHGVDCTKLLSSNPADRYGEYSKGDVGILLLKSPASVTPDTLVASTAIKDTTSGTIVGFGYAEDNTYGAKKQASALIVSPTCTGTAGTNSAADSNYYGCVPRRELVAEGPGGVDTCVGDSGGPMLVDTKYGDQGIVAVTSRGVLAPTKPGCGNGGIYARVDANIEFIVALVPSAKVER
jgi:hypothetical protein